MKINYKFWLENEKGKVYGDGPFDILNRVKRTGSLRQAAFEINMSYSQAWNLIRGLEKKLGFKLLQRKVGGIEGGGSELTEEANALQEKYQRFYHQVEQQIKSIYREVFQEK